MPDVRYFDDAAHVLAEVGDRLATDPVHCNLVLSLLHGRAERPEQGRYWVVTEAGVAGLVFQSPLSMPATVTPLPAQLARFTAAAVARDAPDLPGVVGEAGTAAAFAGQWTERTGRGARPVMAQRLYELADLHGPRQLSKGFPRLVTLEEVDLATKWLVGFAEEAGEPEAFDDARSVVTHRVAGGGLWFWDVGEPVALAGRRDPVAGAVRIGPVYTPKDHRRHGYATALTHALSERARDDGHRCLLYTDLNYPTSNSIYRALGYRAVAEVLRYQFEVPE